MNHYLPLRLLMHCHLYHQSSTISSVQNTLPVTFSTLFEFPFPNPWLDSYLHPRRCIHVIQQFTYIFLVSFVFSSKYEHSRVSIIDIFNGLPHLNLFLETQSFHSSKKHQAYMSHTGTLTTQSLLSGERKTPSPLVYFLSRNHHIFSEGRI